MQAELINLQHTLEISVGGNRQSTDWQPKTITWEDLCARMREPVRTRETTSEYGKMSKDERTRVKDVGGFVGGSIRAGTRKATDVMSRQLVALDADFGSSDLWDNWQTIVGDKAILMHSTHSHTPEHPRLRFIVPLTRPVTPLEYAPVARRLASWIDIEAFDDTTYETNRLMFWPSCAQDAEYIFKESHGDWVDPDEVLASYTDWHDMREWPVSSRQKNKIREKRDHAGDPLSKPGVVGAFNRAYTITAAIEKYLPDVYLPCSAHRMTYAKGSTVGGAVIYDDNTFIYSHHDTDPISGRLSNAYDMVRLHLFGDQDEDSDEALGDLPSTKAMKQLCANDPAVYAEMAERAKSDPQTAFTRTDELERFDSDYTELGAAIQFKDAYGENIRFCEPLGWMYWDGRKWQANARAEVYMLIYQFSDKAFADARASEYAATDKAEKAKAREEMKRAVKLRTATGQASLLTQASNARGLHQATADMYDPNPWELNTPDGIVDLKTGQLRAHDRDAMCTKITAYGMEDGNNAERWAKFIQYITAGNVEFAEYLQTLAGMAAVGEVYEEGLVISYGPGGNGKSTFFGVLRRVMGDYARTTSTDLLMKQRGNTDNQLRADLRGMRLTIMSETDEGARLKSSEMKAVTSRDHIVGRALYKEFMEFVPSHTTIMHTNHLPKLSSLDGGTKRRIAIAPFPATLPPEEVITNYEQVLEQECSGVIMRWIVEGAMRFYKENCKLRKPKCVTDATDKYFAEEDTVQQFIDDCCEQGPAFSERTGTLYANFSVWARANGHWEKNLSLFGRDLASKNFDKVKTKRGFKIKGLRLLPVDAMDESADD